MDVYRFGGTVLRWAYVGTGASGASFTDNLPDLQILTAPTPSQVLDSNTGISRFNLYQPFPIGDRVRFSTSNGTITQAGGTGIWTLTRGGADTFNVGIAQGSLISIGGASFHVYQVRSATVIELAEDATGTLTSGSTYFWSIPAGTLILGTPCPHIWGPYGTGVQGSVIFGCGAANAAGTLFWTNGNDPDSADITGSLVVTSPSERLTGGCVYNGLSYCWSTERMFQIFPSLSTPGQFYVQEVVGGKGLLMEWSLTVQSNSIADQSISWVGKDGIYNFSPSTGTQSLTDRDLYPFFPHDNTIGQNLSLIFPWCNEVLYAPDFNQGTNPIPFLSKYHKLTWIDGELFYDYPTQLASTWATLVFDSKNVQGWVSVDAYLGANAYLSPISRMTEIGANNMKLWFGGKIYDYSTMVGTATDDAGTGIASRVITRADDSGDIRAQKLYGDIFFDANPNSHTVTVNILDFLHTNVIISPTVAQATRTGQYLDLTAGGLGALSNTLGLDITWTGAGTTLYQWQYSFVPKPEFQGRRALDKTDDGWVGAKYVRGFVIECNTANQARKVNVLIDFVAATNPLTGTAIFTINSGLNPQVEIPLAIVPQIGQELQISIDASDSSTVGWEVFAVRWVWEKWPDLAQENSAVMNLGTNKAKEIRSIVLPMDTNGAPVTFTVKFDSGASVATYTLPATTTTANKKTPVAFAFDPPVIAHTVEFQPNAPVRAWYEECEYTATPWPEIISEYSTWLEPSGRSKPAYIRGFSMPIDTGGVPVIFNLRVDTNTTISIGTFTTVANIKTTVPFVITTPVVRHQVRVEPQSATRCWWGEIVWDAEEYPELSLEDTAIVNCGYGKAKFMQGLVIPLDTDGAAVQFQFINIDTGLVAYTSPAVIATGKQMVAFSWPPFIAHLMQIIPLGAARIFIQEAAWVWEPQPELALYWKTPQMTHGMSGWLHQRLYWVAYLSTAPVSFTRTFSDGTSETYTLASTAGIFTKLLLPVTPKKSLWYQYGTTSTDPHRMFVQDFEMHMKQWGSEGPYSVQKPIGAASVVQGAEI